MVTFELVSDQEVTINGIGLLRAGQPVLVDQAMLDHFEAEHGYRLGEANLPKFVKLVAVLDNDDESKEV